MAISFIVIPSLAGCIKSPLITISKSNFFKYLATSGNKYVPSVLPSYGNPNSIELGMLTFLMYSLHTSNVAFNSVFVSSLTLQPNKKATIISLETS